MWLTRKEFDILDVMQESGRKLSLEEIARRINGEVSVDAGELKALQHAGLIKDGRITKAGITALKPYRVKSAVILAAGLGSRMWAITKDIPKPLVKIHGKRIIDTLLDALIEVEIENIVVVRGYLSEQFDQLLSEYPMIKFVENPEYKEANNIASAMYVKDLLKNAYILEADLVLKNKKLIKKYQYTSNYLGVPVKTTDDWCFYTKDQIIQSLQIGGRVEETGPYKLYHTFGISYWNEKDGKQLEEDIPIVYQMLGGKEKYWDQVPLEYCRKNYTVEVRECSFEDIMEIDTFDELNRVDNTY